MLQKYFIQSLGGISLRIYFCRVYLCFFGAQLTKWVMQISTKPIQKNHVISWVIRSQMGRTCLHVGSNMSPVTTCNRILSKILFLTQIKQNMKMKKRNKVIVYHIATAKYKVTVMRNKAALARYCKATYWEIGHFVRFKITF